MIMDVEEYADLIHDLALKGEVIKQIPRIGDVEFLSCGVFGEFMMVFPDGTKGYSSEYAERISKIPPSTVVSDMLKSVKDLKGVPKWTLQKPM